MPHEPVVLTITEIVRANLWAIRERNRLDSASPSESATNDEPTSRPWTQVDVAARLGVPERTYGSWERDPKDLPANNKAGRQSFTVEELVHLARVLGCDVTTLLQPSKTLLRSGLVIEVPALPGTSDAALRVSGEDYSLWLSSIQALPEQSDARFDRLTRDAHDHGPKGDLRTRRARAGATNDDDGNDPAAGQPFGPPSAPTPPTGWRDTAPSTPDTSLTRAEMARRALWSARRAIRIAQMVPHIDAHEGDSGQQALDDALDLLDEMGELLLLIADQGPTSSPEGPLP